MRPRQTIRFVLPLAAVIVVFSSSLLAADPKPQSVMPPPAAEPQFKPGDTLAVASEGAQVMLGDRAIAALRKGQRIIVAEFRDPWVGTHVMHRGEKKAGWIRIHDFLPPAGAAHPEGRTIAAADSAARPQVTTTVTSIVAEAAETAPRVPLRSSTPAGRESPDAFLIGKYDRHETDPNVHVWEPWRQR